jgi:hypothetical protein
MKSIYAPFLVAAGLFAATATYAADTAMATAPADAPKGTTAKCTDGTYSKAKKETTACTKHQGVASWYGPVAAAPAAAPMAAPAATPAATAAPATAAAPAPMKASAKTPRAVAPGGGPGLVWVNTSSKKYHCNGDEWYGTTKAGEYMSEADAKTKGFKAAGNKACS